jgi:hypothetical protein
MVSPVSGLFDVAPADIPVPPAALEGGAGHFEPTSRFADVVSKWLRTSRETYRMVQ